MLVKSVCLLQVLSFVSIYSGSAHNYHVRLTNSMAPCAGVVQAKMNGEWERVCASQWDLQDAAVVCKELGCGAPYSVPPASAFGAAVNEAVGISDVQCRGDEVSLLQCPHSTRIQDFCYDGRYAAVNCTATNLENATRVTEEQLEQALRITKNNIQEMGEALKRDKQNLADKERDYQEMLNIELSLELQVATILKRMEERKTQ
ncbi:hypothetical protein NDU88_000287 [Pleurodeles waltl]|uniref:SRCR domain-containing protein n=1 Tax=Pleurodeles waltl TaxID=8319 RepID=A0AAV7V6E6_PLEWA|nr:hypothetical protein NDU88_000287 [Pleurodeles waltl]